MSVMTTNVFSDSVVEEKSLNVLLRASVTREWSDI
jgi:hypothetical protein